MPNITWQEPQVIVDVLAMNLLADQNGMNLGSSREIAVVSPWLSDVEIALRPGPWYQQLTIGEKINTSSLHNSLATFCQRGWDVHVAVLAYGMNSSGIVKPPDKFSSERSFLRKLIGLGAKVHLVPNLHAKGIVTPLAIITGSTNLTNSGLYAQGQNSNYFAFKHPDFYANRVQLLAKFQHVPPAQSIA
jgi:hypothetical protein